MGYFGAKQILLKNGAAITLRDPEPTDAAALIEHLDRLTRDGVGQVLEYGEFVPSIEDEQRWVESTRANPNEILVAAFFEGQLIGLVDFRHEKRRRMSHVGSFGIGVLPQWRDQGVGRVIIESMIDWLIHYTDIEIVQLGVLADNERAIALYEKLGFVIEGRKQKYFKFGPGHYVDELLMAKVLR
jgi:RimJ/RimL family protein N-acetyltransferase